MLPLAFGIGLIVAMMFAVTVYCGNMIGRWAPFEGLEKAQTALHDLPWVIGDWESDPEKAGKLAKEDVAMLEIENGYIVRSYKNARTGAIVNLMMMVGPTGRVVVHTPEICFGGRDYEKQGSPAIVSIPIVNYSGEGDSMDTFWKLNFVNNSARGGTISFYYAVSVGEAWKASDDPRSHFQRYRFAYKIQAEAFADGEIDNVEEFLTDCLPTIHEHLRPCR